LRLAAAAFLGERSRPSNAAELTMATVDWIAVALTRATFTIVRDAGSGSPFARRSER
jgi:hypothetical protein